MAGSHSFNFEGGEELTVMGASWFVSYAYYDNIDLNHTAWDRVKTYSSRISVYNRSKKYHQFWLTRIVHMDDNRLNTNKIGLTAYEVKSMAAEVLKKMWNV